MNKITRAAILVFVCGFLLADLGLAANRRGKKKAAESTSYSKKDISSEITFGRVLAASVLTKHRLVKDKKQGRYAQLIGRGISESVGRGELAFYFGVIESEAINAYALPGGYIFITSKAMELMENEAELVGVLAHEVAHVNRRHILQTIKFKKNSSEFVGDVEVLVGGGVFQGLQTMDIFMDKAFELLYEDGLKEHYEFEADSIAIEMMIALEYNPQSYIDYLKKVKTQTKGSKDSIYTTTHPPLQDRIEKVTEQLAAIEFAGEKRTNQKRFKKYVRSTPPSNLLFCLFTHGAFCQ